MSIKAGDSAADQSVATQIVDLAVELYELGMARDGEPFAVPRTGPKVARLLRGSGYSLRCALSEEYGRRTGRTPGNGALAAALTRIEGRAPHTDTGGHPLR